MRQTVFRRFATFGLVGVIGLLPSCGSSSKTTASPTTVPSSLLPSSVVPSPTTGSPASTTSVAGGQSTTTQGTASSGTGKATLSPIKVGFRSLDGGPVSLPEIFVGFKEGIKYVNEELGGVRGHPIQVSECKVDATPEKSIDCANKAIEEGIVLSVQGADPSADAALPALKAAGIGEVTLAALGSQQQADVGHSFVFSNPAPSSYLGAVLALKTAGASKIRIFQGDSATARSDNTTWLKPTGEKVGVDTDTIFYPLGSADWSSLVATAMSKGANGIGMVIASEGDCTAMISAAVQLGYKGAILAGNCTQFVQAVGKEASAGVLTFGDLYPPDVASFAAADKSAEVATYVKRMTAAGHAEMTGGFAQQAFSLAVTLARALSQIQGDAGLTAKDVVKGLSTVKGQRFMGNDFNCDGTMWKGTTACQQSLLVMKQQPDGKRGLAAGNGYLDLTSYRPS
jgi:branched-chain amino acid transport system substrate-binding protein